MHHHLFGAAYAGLIALVTVPVGLLLAAPLWWLSPWVWLGVGAAVGLGLAGQAGHTVTVARRHRGEKQTAADGLVARVLKFSIVSVPAATLISIMVLSQFLPEGSLLPQLWVGLAAGIAIAVRRTR